MTAYGIALALGFSAGIALACLRAPRMGLERDRVLDLSLLIVATSIAGARALFVATHPESVAAPDGSWAGALLPGAGLSMLGGLVVAAAASLLWLRAKGLPMLRYADLLAPSVTLGEAIARVGCFVQGCCSGVETALPWGVGAGARLVHPTQLYLSLLALASFAVLLRIAGRRARPGTVCFAWLLLAGTSRLLVDPLRAYETPGILAANALLALAVAAAGAAGLWAVSQSSRFSSQCTSQ